MKTIWKETLMQDLKHGMEIKLSYQSDAAIFRFNGLCEMNKKLDLTNIHNDLSVKWISYLPNKLVITKILK